MKRIKVFLALALCFLCLASLSSCVYRNADPWPASPAAQDAQTQPAQDPAAPTSAPATQSVPQAPQDAQTPDTPAEPTLQPGEQGFNG